MKPALSAGERLLLEVAAVEGATARRAVVLDDRTGAVSTALLDQMPIEQLTAHTDRLTEERTLRAGLEAVDTVDAGDAGAAVEPTVSPRTAAVHPMLTPATISGADLVLARLPKSLGALDELAGLVRDHADPNVRMLGLGQNQHLNRGMNAVLSRHFDDVHASRGRGKHRVLIASQPRSAPRRDPAGTSLPAGYPRQTRRAIPGPDPELIVCAHGAAFAQTKIDAGTRLLLQSWSSWPAAVDIIDLGCGTGVVAVAAARCQRDARVLALDESAAACASAVATAAANQLSERIAVRRADGLTDQADASADLILCNPPFHVGTAKDTSRGWSLVAGAARVLRPDGELWTVVNRHLPYRNQLDQAIGPSEVVSQNRGYLVIRTRRSPTPASTA